jgi:hypothetical protein
MTCYTARSAQTQLIRRSGKNFKIQDCRFAVRQAVRTLSYCLSRWHQVCSHCPCCPSKAAKAAPGGVDKFSLHPPCPPRAPFTGCKCAETPASKRHRPCLVPWYQIKAQDADVICRTRRMMPISGRLLISDLHQRFTVRGKAGYGPCAVSCCSKIARSWDRT